MTNLPHDQFLNETVMPWDQLSVKLAQPISVDPQTSTVIADAGAILTALRHAPERFDWPLKGAALNDAVIAEFPLHRLIMDAADSWKHGKLADPKRQVTFVVTSQFLLNQLGHARFLRNIICINHATLGEADFQVVARDGIRFWLQKQAIKLAWPGTIYEGANIYRDAAVLTTTSGIQVLQRGARISFVVRNALGELVAAAGMHSFVIVDDPSLLASAPIASSI